MINKENNNDDYKGLMTKIVMKDNTVVNGMIMKVNEKQKSILIKLHNQHTSKKQQLIKGKHIKDLLLSLPSSQNIKDDSLLLSEDNILEITTKEFDFEHNLKLFDKKQLFSEFNDKDKKDYNHLLVNINKNVDLYRKLAYNENVLKPAPASRELKPFLHNKSCLEIIKLANKTLNSKYSLFGQDYIYGYGARSIVAFIKEVLLKQINNTALVFFVLDDTELGLFGLKVLIQLKAKHTCLDVMLLLTRAKSQYQNVKINDQFEETIKALGVETISIHNINTIIEKTVNPDVLKVLVLGTSTKYIEFNNYINSFKKSTPITKVHYLSIGSLEINLNIDDYLILLGYLDKKQLKAFIETNYSTGKTPKVFMVDLGIPVSLFSELGIDKSECIMFDDAPGAILNHPYLEIKHL